MIVAAPAATAVTRPLPDTVATAGALLAQVTTRPVRALPAESLGVGVSWAVPPIDIADDAGLTLTEATGTAVTLTAAVPLLPSLVAVIVAEPAALAVTSPPALTVATVVLPLAHVIVRPVSTLPAESFVVTDSCAVWPTNRLVEAGFTVTAATGTTLVDTVAVPLFPSLVAVIVAAPAATAVTRPLPDTVATAGALLAQVTTRPVRGLPFASFGIALSWTV